MYVLVYYSGWNYLLELYFWLIIAALIIVSITIFFARPKNNKLGKTDLETYEGNLNELDSSNSFDRKDNIKNVETDEENELDEKENSEIILAQEKRKWTLGFAVFGLVFVMVGGLVIYLFEFDFTMFFGSCMIYVGIMSLIKGLSLQILFSERKTPIVYSFPIIIFAINFILLDDLLGVIGKTAWMLMSDERRAGDLLLIYILPYFLWKLVPSFEKSDDDKLKDSKTQRFVLSHIVRNIFSKNLYFTLFAFILIIYTEMFNAQSLMQYASAGFSLSITILMLTLPLYIIVSIFGASYDQLNRLDSGEIKK